MHDTQPEYALICSHPDADSYDDDDGDENNDDDDDDNDDSARRLPDCRLQLYRIKIIFFLINTAIILTLSAPVSN